DRVVIGERDDLVARLPERAVPGRAQALAVLAHVADPVVHRDDPLRLPRRRTVVDDEELMAGLEIRVQRIEAAPQVVRPVPRADRDRRLLHGGLRIGDPEAELEPPVPERTVRVRHDRLVHTADIDTPLHDGERRLADGATSEPGEDERGSVPVQPPDPGGRIQELDLHDGSRHIDPQPLMTCGDEAGTASGDPAEPLASGPSAPASWST